LFAWTISVEAGATRVDMVEAILAAWTGRPRRFVIAFTCECVLPRLIWHKLVLS
jgi:hypothetical protein